MCLFYKWLIFIIMNTFYNDLAVGERTQKEVETIFINRGFSLTASTGYFPDYDMAVAQCPLCKVYTIEVKDDIKSKHTGNAAIELHKVDSEGNKIDSGLSITKAHAYIIKLNDKFYSIPTKKLKKLLKDNWGNYTQIITKDNKMLALLSVDFLAKNCKVFE